MADEKVSSLLDRWKDAQREQALERDRHRRGNDNGGNGGEPPMSNFEARITRLEDQTSLMQQSLARIEAKLDGFSTKEDLGNLRAEMHNLLRQQIMWSVGTIIATGGLVFAIMRFASS